MSVCNYKGVCVLILQAITILNLKVSKEKCLLSGALSMSLFSKLVFSLVQKRLNSAVNNILHNIKFEGGKTIIVCFEVRLYSLPFYCFLIRNNIFLFLFLLYLPFLMVHIIKLYPFP